MSDMASDTVNEDKAAEFISIDAKYLIAPGNTAESLMNDSSNLLSCAIAIMLKSFEELSSDLYGALYLMQQAKSAHDEAHSVLVRAGKISSC